MREIAQIDFCCNDPDNGAFAGKVFGAHYHIDKCCSAELEADAWPVGGYAFTELSGGRLRIHRRIYRFHQSKDWFGNWCWNAYWLPRKDAKRLLNDLRASGRWRCISGPSHFYRWFNRETAEVVQ